MSMASHGIGVCANATSAKKGRAPATSKSPRVNTRACLMASSLGFLRLSILAAYVLARRKPWRGRMNRTH